MREYQQELLKSESKIVMCNWERGSGKTYSVIQKILREGGDWVFITPCCHNKQRLIYNELHECLKGEKLAYHIKTDNNRIELTLLKDKDVHIYFETPDNFRFSIKYDFIVFDDCEHILDNDIRVIIKEAKTIRGLKQIIITTTMDYFEYISDKEEVIDVDKTEWIEQQIKELMIEFSKIRKDERTTMTREKILGMIRQLENLRCK